MTSLDLIKFSFCQISDLNLDSSDSLSLKLSPTQRQERTEETLTALARAMEAARSRCVDAILVPGHLFNSAGLRTASIAAVQEIFASLNEIPVYLSAGAEDPLYRDSPYSDDFLKARGLSPWSSNVHVFRKHQVQTLTVTAKPSVRISGLALKENSSLNDCLPTSLPESERSALNLLLLPLDKSTLQEAEQALLSERLQDCGFSYCAFSGCKNGITLHDRDGNITAAACGTFLGQSPSESGPRQVIFGQVLRNPVNNENRMSLNFEEFDPRRIYSFSFDLSNTVPQEKEEEIKETIKKSGARERQDIIVLQILGTYKSGNEPFRLDAELKNNFFQVLLDDRSRPDYLLNLRTSKQFEAHFISLLEELKEKSCGNIAESVIEDALYYGLQALREGKVSIGNAD